jgi:SPP1 family predicted phage head-tail adaptor
VAEIGAAHLDRKITIQRATTAADAFNEYIETWADHLTNISAMKRDVSDGERFAAGQVGSHQMARFTVRSWSETRAVTRRDRLVYEQKNWNIIGFKETGHGRNRFLEITAVADAD